MVISFNENIPVILWKNVTVFLRISAHVHSKLENNLLEMDIGNLLFSQC